MFLKYKEGGGRWVKFPSPRKNKLSKSPPSKHLLVFKTSSTRRQHVFSVTIIRLPRRLEDVLQRRLEEVLKTSLRPLARHLQDVFKTSWKTKNCYAEDVFKKSWRHVLKTSWRHVLKTFWRRLGGKQNVYWGYLYLTNPNVYLTNLYFTNPYLTHLRRIQSVLLRTQ